MKWYHWLILFFIGALLVLATADKASAQDLSLMHQQTVRIQTPTGVGSGVVIGPNTILTAKHVVQDNNGKTATAIYVQPYKGDRIKIASNIQLIEGVDVAIIHGAAIGITPAKVSCTPLKQGDEVDAGGFTLDLMYMYSNGYISGIGLYESFYYLAYLAGGHGNSGGPVYNKAGEVIAIFHGGISDKKKEGVMISVLAAMSPICDKVKKGIY
jgi:glutamyl endopeptidase